MKKLLLSLVLMLGTLFCVNAQDYIRINSIAKDTVHMGLFDTLTVSVDATWQNNLSYHSWLLRGDLTFVAGYNASMSTIKIVSSKDGYGKGRITYRYRTLGCTSAESVDVYKEFTPPKGLSIEGSTCVEAGDVVVFSIDPILTVNLDDQIGIDHYYWNINDSANRPYFVDSIHYSAGDGSSVTFKVKALEDDSVNEIFLYLGQCNIGDEAKRVSLPLVKQAPKPQLDKKDFYQDYGEAIVRISITNPSVNVHYSWAKPNDWSVIESDADSTYIVLQLDDRTEGDIIVSAQYINNQIECAITQTNLHIYRRWGENVIIDGPTCLISGQEYIYTVKNNLPNGVKVRWELASNNWSYEDDVSQRTIKVTPSSTIGLVDSIKVYEILNTDTLTPRYKVKPVYIKPADVQIIGATCALANTDEVYIAQRTAQSVGPKAQKYEWRINNNIQSSESDTLYYHTPAVGSSIITVKPLGVEDCDAATASMSISIRPTPPNGIVRSDDGHCIARGMEDVIELELDGASGEQTYSWDFSYTHGWHRDMNYDPNSNLSKIKVITSGQEGNDTIIAFANGGDGCRNAEPDTIVFTTAGVPFGLHVDVRNNWYDIYLDPDDLTQLNEFADADTIQEIWYINGISDPENNNMSDISIRRKDYTYSSTIEVIVIKNYTCRYYYSATLGDIIAQEQDNNQLSQVRKNNKVSLDRLNIDSDIKLYPNPVYDILKVQLPENNVRTVLRVYDMNGNLLIRKVADDKDIEELNVSKLSKGAYILKMNQGHEQYVSQFIVNH